jgi:hypothetical protein
VTESEWLVCTDPLELLDCVGAPLEGRKTFLLQAACFRRQWERLPEVARDWVRLAEAAAEGKATREVLEDGFDALEEALNEFGPPGEFVALLDIAWGMWTAEWATLAEGEQEPAWAAERAAQAALVRDVLPSPFRTAVLVPTWRTRSVLDLARAADAGAFDVLPVLGDALEEAGCDNADVLGHCRGSGPHVRGCWVVGLLLGEG